MRQAIRLSALCALSALAVEGVVSAVRIFVWGRFEAKWGGPLDNLVVIMQLAVMTVAVEAPILLALLCLPFARRLRLRGLPEATGCLVFSGLTYWWYPPMADHMLLTAATVSVVTMSAAVGVAAWRNVKIGGLSR